LGGSSPGEPSAAPGGPSSVPAEPDAGVAVPPSVGSGRSGPGSVGSEPATATTGPALPPGTATTTRPGSVVPPAPGTQGADPPAPAVVVPVRLGAVLPADDEVAEIGLALQRAVEFANRSGGVGGRPVELRTAPAHDPGAVRAMTRSVDALVGGTASAAVPAGIPWVFPADPAVGGEGVVAAEASPFEVGARLADDLVGRGIPGPVGAIVGEGPEAALADGVATRRPTIRVRVAGADDSCREPVRALRRRDVAALVLAGPPALVDRCTQAAAWLAWRPPGGILVPPSAAYAHLERSPAAQGVRTVLGLPWPDSDTPGANRYRAAVPGGQSYRALVSFAAVELAVQAARNDGAVQAERLRSGSWRSDLFHLEEGHHQQRPVMVASLGRWIPQAPPPPPGATDDRDRRG
jgi:ABC-type branched-subunit amino acid transport system substrate-binding protein